MDTILKKHRDARTIREIAYVAEHLQYTRFFKELKFKQF